MASISTAELLAAQEWTDFHTLHKRFHQHYHLNGLICFIYFGIMTRWFTLFRAIGSTFALIERIITSIIIVFVVQQSLTAFIAFVLLMLQGSLVHGLRKLLYAFINAQAYFTLRSPHMPDDQSFSKKLDNLLPQKLNMGESFLFSTIIIIFGVVGPVLIKSMGTTITLQGDLKYQMFDLKEDKVNAKKGR